MSSFNQGVPGPATLINSSSTLLYGNTTSGTALTVQQLGAGAVMNVATSTGSSALFVSSTGQVGVGTNSQFVNGFGSGLMVNSGTINGSNAFNMVLLSNATTVNYTQVGQIGFGIGGDMPSFSIQSQAVNRDNGAGPYYDYGAQSDLRFLYKTFNTWPAGGVNEAMRIKGTNGYVGIGTTSPGSALHTAISSATATTIATFENYNTTTTTAKSFKLQFYGNGAGGQKDLGGITIVPTDGNFGYNDMAFSIRGPFGASSAEAVAEVMRFSRSGTTPCVGIGTTNPSAQLHLNGPGQATATAFSTTGLLGGSIILQDSGASAYNGGAVVFGASQGYFAAIKGSIQDGTTNTKGDLYFATRNAIADTTLATRMTITSAGNLGIGTTNPGAQLQIGGTGVTGNVLQIGNFTFQMVSYQGLFGAGTVTYTPSGSGIFVAYYASDTMVFTSSGTVGGQYSAVTTYMNAAGLTGNGGLGQLSLSTAVNGVLTATFKGTGDIMRVFRMAF